MDINPHFLALTPQKLQASFMSMHMKGETTWDEAETLGKCHWKLFHQSRVMIMFQKKKDAFTGSFLFSSFQSQFEVPFRFSAVRLKIKV